MFPIRNLKRNIVKFLQQPDYGFKVLYKRLRALVYYKLKPSHAPLPEAVTLFLTHSCNLRCKMCGQWGEHGVTKQEGNCDLLDNGQIMKIIDSLSSFKPNITLFGGEPLLHPNVIDIVKYIKAKKMHCLMITNGFLLEKYAEDLVNAGIDELNISIDGVGKVHDEIRGISGLYEKITSGIAKINSLRKGPKPLINIQTTITKYNYETLDKMLEAAEKMHADSITFHNLIFLSNEDIESTEHKYPFLQPDDWRGFVADPEIDPVILNKTLKRIKEAQKDHKFMVNVYPNFTPDEIEDYYNDKSWFPKSYKGRCISAWVCAYVFPDGELRPCLNFKHSFGNLGPMSFKEAWNSSAAQKFRSSLSKAGRFPVCSRCTEIFRY